MNLTKPKILIISSEFPPQPGGIGNHAYNLAFGLSNEGFNVVVVTDQRSSTGREEESFDRDVPFKIHRIKRRSIRVIMYVQRILAARRHAKTVSTIIATGKFSLWIGGFLNRFKEVKRIAVIHGTEVNFKSKAVKRSIELALKKFDQIVAVSEYTKSLIDHLKLEVSVIPNGINNSNWNKTSTQSKTLQGNPIITTVGRVSERKGQRNVIKLLPELTMLYPDMHYHCVGIPTEVEECIKEAKNLNVDSLITFHGSQSEESLKYILSQTDIFVMLSSESKTGDVEGFGIAVLEANAMGIPAIGSINCGIEDAILEGKSGRLIRHNDPSSFKDAIQDLLANREHYQQGAIQWAKQHDWSNIIKLYISEVE